MKYVGKLICHWFRAVALTLFKAAPCRACAPPAPLILVAAVALLFLPNSGAQSQNGAPAAGNAQNGKAAYMKSGCYTCHGTMGQGGAGARLTPVVLNTAGFTTYVRKGGQRGGGGGMPAFPSYVMSDSDLADIRAYLASIPAPPPAKSIPLLND